MKATARSVAYQTLLSVENDDAYANLLLPKLLKQAKLEARDSGMAQELAFGTLRRQGTYDRIIEIAAGRKLADITGPAKILLRLGAHQLLGMRVSAHAAINETVNLAKEVASQGAVGFVNGCLRRVSERDLDQWLAAITAEVTDQAELLAVTYSHPAWVVRALQKGLEADGRGSELAQLLESDNVAPKVNLVALPGLALEDDVADLAPTAASPVGFELEGGDPGRLESVIEGRMRVQDAGSQLAALALSRFGEDANRERSGELWLDMCAGPGGKAALLAAEARLHGAKLTASELQPHRTSLVVSALGQSGLIDGVEIVTTDAREWGNATPNKFDRILLDAPCSGLGALRRRPEARWRKQPKDIGELSRLQEQLLTSAWLALKPGGVLAYVTCSPHIGETASVIEWAVRKFGDTFEQLDTAATLRQINPELELNDSRKSVQLWSHIHGTDDMFIALIRKSLG